MTIIEGSEVEVLREDLLALGALARDSKIDDEALGRLTSIGLVAEGNITSAARRTALVVSEPEVSAELVRIDDEGSHVADVWSRDGFVVVHPRRQAAAPLLAVDRSLFVSVGARSLGIGPRPASDSELDTVSVPEGYVLVSLRWTRGGTRSDVTFLDGGADGWFRPAGVGDPVRWAPTTGARIWERLAAGLREVAPPA